MSQTVETASQRFLPSEELARMALAAQEKAGGAAFSPGPARGDSWLPGWLSWSLTAAHGNILLPLLLLATSGLAVLELAPGEMEHLRLAARVLTVSALFLAVLSFVGRWWPVPEPAMTDRIEVAPSGPPAGESSLVERTRESLGARVGRLISELAYSAAARGESELALSGPAELTPLLRRKLAERLPFPLADDFLVVLRRDLAEHAASGQFGGPWGRVTLDGGALAVRLNPFERAVADRPRARLVD